jgi:hypothetical protein
VGITQIRNKAAGQPAKPSIEPLTESNKLPEMRIDPPNSLQSEHCQQRRGICGAMAEQSGDSGWGNQLAPQKLLHLVGCREQKAPAKRPNPTKR